MEFLHKLAHDPMSFIAARPWWQKVLLVLPWILLVGLAIFIWVFLSKGSASTDFAKKTENIPYDKLDAAVNRNVLELEKARKEFAAKVARKEDEIRRDAAIFERTRQDIARESHEQLIRRLEGK